MVQIRNIKLKSGYIRKPGSNSQIKVLGKAHRELIDRERIGNITRREKIKKFELLLDLWRGDINAVSGLVDLKYRFKNRDIKALSKILRKNKYIARVTLNNGDVKRVTLTKRGYSYIRQALRLRYFKSDVYKPGSDTLAEIAFEGVKSISIELLEKPKKIFKNKSGKLFKYINKSDIDLERYQILSESSDISLTKDNCLLYAFEKAGLDKGLINAVRSSCRTSQDESFDDLKKNNVIGGSYISTADLKKISKILNRSIILFKFRNKINKIIKTKIGDYEEEIKIAIYENHYFVFEDTNYTTYSVRNYEIIKNIEGFENIIGLKKKRYIFDENAKKCNSLNMVRYLMECKYFDPNHHRLAEIEGFVHEENNIDIPLTNIENEQELYEHNKNESKKLSIFYADTETMVTEGEHKCLLTGIIKEGHKKVQIRTYRKSYQGAHIRDMLDYADFWTRKEEQIIIYFHNLKYDWSVLKNDTYTIEQCEKDGAIYSITLIHNKRKIELRDSYKLFSEPLSKFCDTFALGKDMKKKEAIGYTYYNTGNIRNEKHLVSEYIKHVKGKDKKLFMKILNEDRKNKNNFFYDGKYFDAMRYYRYYLKYDCLVLMNGFKVFKQKIKQITGLNIHDSLTISSLANKHFSSKGSFDGLYKVKSNLRDYLSKAITGGRCTVLESEIKKKITKILVDYDACSLYPSAIYRMCLEMGLPKGKAKKISGYNKKYLDEKDYYVVTVNIKKVKKKQQIPFISMKDESGILRYINEVPKGGYKCIIDKITLEDYIEFHDIEYEIIDGVYWDEGFNKTFGKEIEKLYTDRLIEKAKAKNKKLKQSERDSGEVMQGIIKLMLNSAYGKTIIKKSKLKKVIKKIGRETDSYIYNNFHIIREIKKISDKQCIIELDTIDDSSNLAHVGGLVLSYSKRIMNEVMGLASDNKIKVYYQDTDSMHIEKDKIEKLEKLYENKYGKELNGKNMGNFHSDFSLKGADNDIYSVESYFLGKKCYIDKLECINKDKSIVTGYHIRLKGVTKAGIDYTIKNTFDNDPLKMFEYLAEENKLTIPLNPKDSVSMLYTDTGVISRETETYTREISF